MGEKFFIKSIEKVKINANIPEDLTVKKIVDHHLGNFKYNKINLLLLDIIWLYFLNIAIATIKLEKELGNIKTDLDGRYDTVRNHESNLGNFVSLPINLLYS